MPTAAQPVPPVTAHVTIPSHQRAHYPTAKAYSNALDELAHLEPFPTAETPRPKIASPAEANAVTIGVPLTSAQIALCRRYQYVWQTDSDLSTTVPVLIDHLHHRRKHPIQPAPLLPHKTKSTRAGSSAG